MYNYLANMNVDLGVRVNPDEIEHEQNVSKLESGRIARNLIKKYINERVSFHQETTLVSRTIAGYIADAKKKNFTVNLYYVMVESADLAVERSRKRFEEGGHFVPEEQVRRSYNNSQRDFPQVIDLCDYIEVWDNTSRLELVCSFVNGKLEPLFKDLPVYFNFMFPVNERA